MSENSNKVLSFPSPVPAKADYQRVKSNYSIREIKQLFGLSERTIRRWTEQGIIQATSSPESKDYRFDFHALTQFRRVRELKSQGQSIRQIEAELQGQLNLFRTDVARLARLLTPFEEALLLHERGDPKAADCYVEAIGEGDNVAEAYCNLAIISLEQGNTAKALDNFTLSLKSDPRHVEAHYNLGNLNLARHLLSRQRPGYGFGRRGSCIALRSCFRASISSSSGSRCIYFSSAPEAAAPSPSL